MARWMADASLEEISTLDSQYSDISSVWSPAKDNHTDPLASVPTVHDWLTSGKTNKYEKHGKSDAWLRAHCTGNTDTSTMNVYVVISKITVGNCEDSRWSSSVARTF